MSPISPAAWDAAWSRYRDARDAEKAFDGQHITPFLGADTSSIPMSIWERSGELTEARAAAEDPLFEMQAPDFQAFAQKVIICRADGRQLDSLDDHLVEEAERLIAAPRLEDPHPTWLADRNQLWTIVNRWAPMADGLMDELADMLSVFEKRIAETSATTPMGWIAKAAVLLQLPAEGFEPSPKSCGTVLAEAQHLFGITLTGDLEAEA